MIRLIAGAGLLLASAALHLGARDKRKGSHNQKSHGSHAASNPFSSKAAFNRVAGRGVTKTGTGVAFAAPLPKGKTQGRGAGRTLRGGTVTGIKKDSGSVYVKSGVHSLVVPKSELIPKKKARKLKTKPGKRLRK